MISVVIPTYNRCDITLALLADIYAQRDVEFEVIVVDDCSANDPTETILARFPQCRVLRNTANSGPAVSRNRGILAAVGTCIVGFDSDVSVPDTNLLRRVANAFEQEREVSGFAFRILRQDGKTDDLERWWHPVPITRYANRRFATAYFSGTAYAFRRDALISAGLFPEIFFMHYEEVELAFRLIDQGGCILYAPDFCAWHHAHPVSRRNEILVFYKPRNQILLAAGCLPPLRAAAYVTPRLAFHCFRAFRHGHVASFVRALRSAREKLPVRLQQRRVLRPSTFRRLTALRAGIGV